MMDLLDGISRLRSASNAIIRMTLRAEASVFFPLRETPKRLTTCCVSFIS